MWLDSQSFLRRWQHKELVQDVMKRALRVLEHLRTAKNLEKEALRVQSQMPRYYFRPVLW